MRLKRHVSLVETSLKRFSSRASLLSPQCVRRRYASSSAYPEQIAVLGGGISGLSSAWFLAKEFPNSKITVFEAGKDAGGWIKSKKVGVAGGHVLLERGPRTLRPGAGALPTAQLIEHLGLSKDLLTTVKDSEAAQNRYIYYPDRLNRLPGGDGPILPRLLMLASSGILNGAWNILAEPWRPRRPDGLLDESVASFISRRIDRRFADNIISPILHGIYAGDIEQLSAKTLMSMLWQLEGKYGSVLRGWPRVNLDSTRPEFLTLWHPYAWEEHLAMKQHIEVDEELLKTLNPEHVSTFTFREGLQQLPQKLEGALRLSGVNIETNSPVMSFSKATDGSGQIEVVAGKGDSPTPRKFDFVISTLPAQGVTDAVTVMVVNLYWKNPNLIPQRGFGYLIPRSVPFEQNPERALGVIFDHDAVQGQDTHPGTKLTVMMGGHWWNGWEGFPDSEEGAEMAKSVVARHLKITEEPDICNVTLNKECIPQYTVGYESRVKDLAIAMQDEYNGRVRVVGTQFNGVGVNDCIKGAWKLVHDMKTNGWMSRSAGLDKALDEREWVAQPVAKMGGERDMIKESLRNKDKM